LEGNTMERREEEEVEEGAAKEGKTGGREIPF
jgi:hypothetical protein